MSPPKMRLSAQLNMDEWDPAFKKDRACFVKVQVNGPGVNRGSGAGQDTYEEAYQLMLDWIDYHMELTAGDCPARLIDFEITIDDKVKGERTVRRVRRQFD